MVKLVQKAKRIIGFTFTNTDMLEKKQSSHQLLFLLKGNPLTKLVAIDVFQKHSFPIGIQG